MKLYVIILSLLLQGVWGAPCAKASEADLVWQDGVGSAKAGEYDFAYMDFHTIFESYPSCRYYPEAEFAQGEYFFLQNNLPMAANEFKNFYARFPRRDESAIALIYLFKIAQAEKRPAAMKEYQEKIASFRQLIFIFNDKKYFNFLSGFQRKYKLIYYINKVGLYVNDKLFAEVSF